MLTQTYETNAKTTIAEKTDKWLKVIRELSHNTLCEKEVDLTLSTIDEVFSNEIKIDFIGASNSGKSSIINELLDRKVLPVTALSSNVEFEIRFAASEQIESFSFEGISKSLEEIKETIASLGEQEESSRFVLTICSDWLSSKQLNLREKSLDFSDDTLEAVINKYLKDPDMIIFVIDALMPVKRSEVIFLKECMIREIPIIVVLSKIDKIPAEEQDTVISYVKKNVESYSPEISVITIQTNIKNEAYGIDILKTSIENLIEKVDPSQIRSRRIAQTLLKSMETIQINAQVALDVQKKTEDEKKSEIRKLRQEIDSQSLIWDQIEQNFVKRRQNIEEQMRNHLEANSDVILKKLLEELENSKEIKIWWSRDMPFHLQRELQDLIFQLSPSINQQVASDIKWVQEEMAKKFKLTFEIFIEPHITINSDRPKQNELLLSDNSKFEILTKFGTIATVVIAGTAFFTLGTGGFVLAAGAITGLVAEQFIRSNTTKDKEKIRSELKRIISLAIKEYLTISSQNLQIEYGKINENVKKYNSRWQQAQLEALKIRENQDQKRDEINYYDILQKISYLFDEIKRDYALA